MLRREVGVATGEAAWRLGLSLDINDAGGRTRRVRVTNPETRAGTVSVPFRLTAATLRVVPDPDVSLLGRITVRQEPGA